MIGALDVETARGPTVAAVRDAASHRLHLHPRQLLGPQRSCASNAAPSSSAARFTRRIPTPAPRPLQMRRAARSISCAVSSEYRRCRQNTPGCFRNGPWSVSHATGPASRPCRTAARSPARYRCLRQIIRRPGGDVIAQQHLGGASAHQHRHLVLEFLTAHEEPVIGRPLHGVTQRADAARNDRDLLDRVAPGDRQCHQRVPHLMIRDDAPFPRDQDA